MRPLITFVVVTVSITGATLGAQTPAAVPESSAVVVTPSAYQLAAGDVVDIRFSRNPELNEQVQIRPDGRISMTSVGEVSLGGLSVASAARADPGSSETDRASARAMRRVSMGILGRGG